MKIKILPKQLLGKIEIDTQSAFMAAENPDLDLIDDDDLIRNMLKNVPDFIISVRNKEFPEHSIL